MDDDEEDDIPGRTYGKSFKNMNEINILTRIRTLNNMGFHSFGSIFASSPPAESPQEQDISDGSLLQPSDLYYCRLNTEYMTVNAGYTPTSTLPSTPQNRFSEVKRIFSNLGSMRRTRGQVEFQSFSRNHSTLPELSTPLESISTSSRTLNDTPPLSPDLSSVISSISSCSSFDRIRESAGRIDSDDAQHHYLEIKEGKKPERIELPQLFEALDDELDAMTSTRITEDAAEWYGLQYALELSTRERHASEAGSTVSAGEHSKSRESWAAIHGRSIHPYFVEEEFSHWRNWHRYLDRQEEWSKHRKAWEFNACSKELAWRYVEELRTREIIHRQMEQCGQVQQELKDKLDIITNRRLSPYYPRKSRNRPWCLKRSRSIATLSELCR